MAMASEDLLNIAILAGFVVYVGVEARERRRRKRMFEAWGERLGATGFEHTPSSGKGVVRGLAFEARFRPASKHDFERTTIEVACPAAALVLDLRLQNAEEERAVARGEAIDVTTGHAAFDAAWIVEGAPAERARRVLASPGIQDRLLAFASLPDAAIAVGDGNVSLTFRGTEVGADSIATARVELALALAEAVIADARAPRPEGEIDLSQASYRSVARVDPRVAEGREVAALERVRGARAMANLRTSTLGATATLTLATLAAALQRDFPPIVLTPVLAFVSLLVALGIGSLARAARRRAPEVPYDPWMVMCAVGFGALQVAMIVRALLALR